MKTLRKIFLNLLGVSLMLNPEVLYADAPTSSQNTQAFQTQPIQARAILMNPVIGPISAEAPQSIKLKVLTGPAKNCVLNAKAYLDAKRLRHIYQIDQPNCQVNGQNLLMGSIVRGQHNITGTMANSGMGRSYLISNKGVHVTLSSN